MEKRSQKEEKKKGRHMNHSLGEREIERQKETDLVDP